MLLQIRSILFRSFILSIAFLFVAYNVYSMAPSTVLTLVHQFFGVTVAEAKSVILHYYCWVKVVAVWLFFVPALAITWYQFDVERQQQKTQKGKKK